MAIRKANINGLFAVTLLLLTIQPVFEADGNRDASALGADSATTKANNVKMETRPDRQREAPTQVPHMKTELSVHGITTTDAAHVWIVAQEGDEEYFPHPIVLRSTDEGKTWRKRKLDDGTLAFDLYFIDDHAGWIAGANGLILRSTDGGTTWNKQRSPTDSHLMFIQFIDPRIGWIAGEDGKLVRTSDGGGTWQLSKVPGDGKRDFDGRLNALSFADRLRGWFVGDNSAVFLTTDGGKSWQSTAAAVERVVRKRRGQALNLTDVHFFNSRAGILLADVIRRTADYDDHQALVLKTKDGGRSWVKTSAKMAGPLWCLNFVNESEGWMITSFGRDLVHTTDGGRSWLGHDVPGVDPDNLLAGGLSALKMVDSKTGWANVNVNDYPLLDTVVHTTDGGRTWRKVKLEDK